MRVCERVKRPWTAVMWRGLFPSRLWKSEQIKQIWRNEGSEVFEMILHIGYKRSQVPARWHPLRCWPGTPDRGRRVWTRRRSAAAWSLCCWVDSRWRHSRSAHSRRRPGRWNRPRGAPCCQTRSTRQSVVGAIKKKVRNRKDSMYSLRPLIIKKKKSLLTSTARLSRCLTTLICPLEAAVCSGV